MSEVICTDDLGVRLGLRRTSIIGVSRTRLHYGAFWLGLVCTTVEIPGMADDLVAERGVLTADKARWQLAVRRAEVIGRLAQQDRVSVTAADQVGAELGLKRRQVYELVKRW